MGLPRLVHMRDIVARLLWFNFIIPDMVTWHRPVYSPCIRSCRVIECMSASICIGRSSRVLVMSGCANPFNYALSSNRSENRATSLTIKLPVPVVTLTQPHPADQFFVRHIWAARRMFSTVRVPKVTLVARIRVFPPLWERHNRKVLHL